MNEYENIGKYISYIYRMAQCFINKKLEPYHIGSGQYTFLLVLFREDGISQEVLSEMVKVDKATTGRAIKRLVEEEYVYRLRDPEDKRSYQIFLTDKGHLLKPILMDILKEWNHLLLQDQEEKKQAVELLGKMARNIYEYRERIHSNKDSIGG